MPRSKIIKGLKETVRYAREKNTGKFEIVEPESDSVVLHKHGTLVLVWCDCHIGAPCPQGKIGSQTCCQVWMEREHISDEGIEFQKRMNRFNR